MFDPTTFTGIHTDISLIAILAGIIAVFGLLQGKITGTWTEVFLVTAILTSATGFGFPLTKLLPSHIVAIIALVALAIAVLALYVFKLGGIWRWLYTTTAVFSLYFLVFVAIAQSFGKIPALKQLAPTQSEPPFAISQGIVLVLFIVLAVVSARTFRPSAVRTT